MHRLLENYFGLTSNELNTLIPNLKVVDTTNWSSQSNVGFDALSEGMINLFTNIKPSNEQIDQQLSNELSDRLVDAQHLNWTNFIASLTTDSPAPLIGYDDILDKCVAALKSGKFIILIGPPGTGKTVLARHLCLIAEANGIPGYVTATATAEWTSFETLGGYFPSSSGSNTLEFVPRLVTESLKSGKWLIVDEINRADIDKAFGELFTLFAGEKVQLPIRDENGKPVVLVPPGLQANLDTESPIYQRADWRMLGTMNTFDKASLFQMSYAFMRRFAFIHIPVPNKNDYIEILTNISREFADLDDAEFQSFRSQTLQYLVEIFCEDNSGLDAVGLKVGPAIPIDIIKFLGEKYRLLKLRDRNIIGSVLVVEALEMYLYPQFEGRDSEHEQILALIVKVCNLNSIELKQTSKNLALWTGFEEGTHD